MGEENIQHVFEQALEHHRAGRLGEAEGLYRQILGVEPGHAEATHHLGLIAQRTGRMDVAVGLLERAAALEPNWAEAQHNLGVALRESGRLDESIAASGRALALNGNLAEAFGNIGDALKGKGLFEEAAGAYRRALAIRPDYLEARHALGNLLHKQGKVDEAIGVFRVGVDQIWRTSGTKWKWPGAGIDVKEVAREVERAATHTSKECSVGAIAGEKFSELEGVGVYLKSLARVFPGDKYILANGLSAKRTREIEELGFKIIQVPRMETVLSGRWWMYDAFIGATRYERYLLTDSKDVLFQRNPFDYPLEEDSVVLAGEGIVHGNSVWNILDQAGFQRSIGVEVDFKDWEVINSGVEYGTRERMKEVVSRLCREMSGPMACTDQAALNYIYHTSLKSGGGYVLALPGKTAFCATGWSDSEGVPGEGYDLQWNGEEFFSPRVGVYGIVHQWERTPFGEEVLKAYRGVDEAGGLNNLGNELRKKGRIDEAVGAFARAIAINPNLAAAHNNLGNVLKEKGQLDEAIAAFSRTIELNPNLAEAHFNLGNARKENGQLDEAIAAYRRAIELDAGNAGFDASLIYALQFHSGYDARAIEGELGRWNSRHAGRVGRVGAAHSNDRDPSRRLRIGYVSPDFWDHVVGRNLWPLFEHHDHREFEIFCYANVERPDAMTGGFKEKADSWRDIAGQTDERVAERIREDGIDILVDLALHMAGNRLLVFARKPAPVQVTFAGYPGHTGLSAVDYRLSDPYLDPIGVEESRNLEKTIRLGESFWCYDPLDCGGIAVNELPAREAGIVTFGCLNNFCKINEGVLAVWARVLGQVGNSRLLMMAPEGSGRRRVVDRLAREGIESSRVEFVSFQGREKYLELYHRIDIGLDSFPYNGHTTSLDSLWMGVPMVTLVGQRAVSRAGWSQLSNLGLRELAAETPEEFVRIAVELARDLPRVGQLRESLRGRMEQSPLMDGVKFARSIEAVYRQMWGAWCEGNA